MTCHYRHRSELDSEHLVFGFWMIFAVFIYIFWGI